MDILKQIFQISAAIIASLGGGAIIIFGCSNWLGKVWASRLMIKEKAEHARELESLRNSLVQETESYKIKLRKSEFIFEKEFEAATALVTLRRKIYPSYDYPEKEWYEACDEMAQNFSKTSQDLDKYLSTYGAVLQENIKELIGSCLTKAEFYRFEVDGQNVSREANKAADELFTKLQEAEKILLERVHSQSST